MRATDLSRFTLLLSALSALACAEDVGECVGSPDGGIRGRDTVLVNGQVQFAGQAIMNQSCAQGCHNSGVSGKDRHGAPAGLDFDLEPIEADGTYTTRMNASGKTLVELSAEQLAGLRARQRKVVSARNRIWQQVKDGLMPPDGLFARFKDLVFSDSDDLAACTAKERFDSIDAKASQDALRNWLACAAPIVEAYGGPIDGQRLVGGAGYQYAECGGSGPTPGDGGTDDGGGASGITIEQVWEQVFEPALCAVCHPSVNDRVDLTSAASSYASLVEDTAVKCAVNGKPYVTKGDPAQSFIYEIVAEEEPTCSMRMPQGGRLTSAQLRLLSDWIAGGALREADLE